jgi:peptidoglycan/LPS O-acetylase OafA/YrhL
MYGTWRILLGMEVFATHFLFIPLLGNTAVFGFFAQSGFLMTSIVQKTYGYSPGGFGRYMTNRAVRLFPSYWFALLITLLIIGIFGADTINKQHSTIAIPETFWGWVKNVTMIFPNITPRVDVPRLIPLAWALTVEIFYFAVIGLGASRSKTITWIWFGVSVVYAAVATQLKHPWDPPGEVITMWQFAAIPAGSLPFAIGALCWHYREPINKWVVGLKLDKFWMMYAIRVVFCVLVVVAAQFVGRSIYMPAIWIVTVLSGVIVAVLSFKRGTDRQRLIDRRVGDYSYALYLLHMQVGIAASLILYGTLIEERSLRGLAVFGLAFLMILPLATIVAFVIDPAMEGLRSRIRPKAAAKP